MNKLMLTLPILIVLLTACSESLQTKEELSKLSYKEFAITVCEAATTANLEQLKAISDDKFFNQMQRMSKKNEFSEFVDNIDCSDVTMTEKTKGSKAFTIATFGGKAKFRIAINKKDGFHSVIS